MCTDTACSLVLGFFIFVNIILTSVVLILLPTTDDMTLLDEATAIVQNGLNLNTLMHLADISHIPSKPYEVFERPATGDCCNGLCRGDTCTLSSTTLMTQHHCNNCCFQLVDFDSCTDTLCRCYANNQIESVTP